MVPFDGKLGARSELTASAPQPSFPRKRESSSSCVRGGKSLFRAPALKALDSRFRGNDGSKGRANASSYVPVLRGNGLVRHFFKASIAVLLLLGALQPAAAAGHIPLIVALGDSLTAGYGLAPEQAFPVRLAAYLTSHGTPVSIENAGVSGDTSAGGRARLDWALADKPQFVILELGGNDALRAIDPKDTEANLDAIMNALDARGIKVLLAGMLAPPNLGRDFGKEFGGIYARLAAKHHAPLYPFFLDGVAGNAALVQADGLHPTAEGVDIIVTRIAPYVEQLLQGAS
jgi:acyl-CoA thioesterase I